MAIAPRPLVEIKFKVDTTSWAHQLGGFARDVIPFAASYALNGTLFAARDAIRDEAKRIFDRPVDFSVRNAFGYTRARLNGDLSARIYILTGRAPTTPSISGAGVACPATSAPVRPGCSFRWPTS